MPSAVASLDLAAFDQEIRAEVQDLRAEQRETRELLTLLLARRGPRDRFGEAVDGVH
jgi:hypothetical protein